MTRQRPENRIARLVEVATEVFIATQGYQRTQMEDVARALGVSKGSLYLYVESKEALFDLCVRHADAPGALLEVSPDLPYRSPGSGETLAYVQTRLAGDASFAELIRLVSRRRSRDPQGDLERIVRVLYRALERHRRTIKLVEAAARDHPGLTEVWFPNARGQMLALLQPFVERHVRSGSFRPVVSAAIASRHVIETCAFWALHRHWDLAPQSVDEDAVEDALVELVSRVFQGGST